MTQPLPSVKEEMQSASDESIIPSLSTLSLRQELRKRLIQERKDTTSALRQAWDIRIQQKLLNVPQIMQADIIGVYSPIRCEPNLLAFYQDLHQAGKQLALPLVLAKDQALAFVPWIPGDNMEKDEFGVLIPTSRDIVIQPNTLLIPCVGYNAGRFRLGYGGGFYDRTLAELPHAYSVGIAYQLAYCDFAPEKFDLAMSIVVTD
ncbi:5-formyltetrahydrofolate cyclo-ligase [Undibacterium sp. Di24W]|uniref:5-formyltetrahydrofolate cyclo-ligase n=1 Tax=Undibacterium sp. Di24W TaxID=3413033 RepID=UPI003BEFFBD1